MKMSQSTLADGICSQPMISRLENNQFNISYDELSRIIERLNMTHKELWYFEEDTDSKKMRRRLDEARSLGQFDVIEKIIKEEKNEDYWSASIELEAYFYWHHGLLSYVKYKDSDMALRAIDEALKRSEGNHLMRMSLPEIYITKGNIFNDQDILDLDCYKAAEQSYRNLGISLHKLEMKILYNMIRTNCRRNEYTSVIRDCNKAINILDKNDSLYLICEIYYFKMLSMLNKKETSDYDELKEEVYALFKLCNKEFLLQNLEEYSVENNLQ